MTPIGPSSFLRARMNPQFSWPVLQKRLVHDVYEHGPHKRRRLAGPGLGNADDVASGHDNGTRLRLDGGGHLITVLLDGLEQLCVEVHLDERGARLRNVLTA